MSALTGKGSEGGRYVHSSREIGNFVHPAAVKPHGGSDGVRDQVNHDVREYLVFREDGLKSIWRIAPDFQFFSDPRGGPERVVRESECNRLGLVLLLVVIIPFHGNECVDCAHPLALLLCLFRFGRRRDTNTVEVNAQERIWKLMGQLIRDAIPTSPPCAPYLAYPSTSVMRRFQSVAVVVRPIGMPLGFDEKPKPGTDGTTTSKASSGEPPKRAGSVSGPIASRNSKTEPGQP